MSEIRRRHGDRIVLDVGRLVYYKGFSQLIRAMANVSGRLLIAGAGPLQPDLMKLTESANLTDRVKFLGSLTEEELHTLYHAADLFVLASTVRSEAFGLVQVEAMAAGTPVINTSLESGVPFVSLHEVTGLTVPPGNPEALSSAISTLLDNHELRRNYGSAARHRAERVFRASLMGDCTLATYQSVMGVTAAKYAAAYA